nr:retropepsin-like aspartic protease [Pseudomonas folii]
MKDGRLSETPKQIDLIPVINISVTEQRLSNIDTSPVFGLALIDTGADHSAIDRDFAKACGFISRGTVSTSGIGGVLHDVDCYDLRCGIDTHAGIRFFDARFVAVPIFNHSRQYQIILGMSFLQSGRLIMDSVSHDYLFEFALNRPYSRDAIAASVA